MHMISPEHSNLLVQHGEEPLVTFNMRLSRVNDATDS